MPRSLLRLLRLHDATSAERRAATWTAAFFFCVLSSYYLLRPLREEYGTVVGKENLIWLFVLTFVLVGVLNTPYMLLANRMPTRRFVPLVLHGFALSFVLLAAATQLAPPLASAAFSWRNPAVLVGAFFYSWVTAFTVCGVTLVWVHAVEWFTTQQGKRLFGFVAVGGTLGAIAASALAWVSSEVPGYLVMLLAVLALELGVLCYRRSLRACEAMSPAPAEAGPRVAAAGALEGLRLVARSPYLFGIAAFVMLAAFVATAFYYTLNDLAVRQIADKAARRELFAQINLFQNVCSLLIQVWITRTALLRLGLAVVLCVMPAVSLLGLGLAAVVPAIGVMAVFEVARRTLQFAFDKPARDVLFTPLDLEAKYKSKAFIDTAVMRAGDLVGAVLNDRLVSWHASSTVVAVAALPVMVVWGAVGMWLGHRCNRVRRPAAGVSDAAASMLRSR